MYQNVHIYSELVFQFILISVGKVFDVGHICLPFVWDSFSDALSGII